MPEAFFSLGAKIMHTPAVLGIYKYLYINIGIIMGSSFRGLELENMCIPKVAYHRQPDKSRKKKNCLRWKTQPKITAISASGMSSGCSSRDLEKPADTSLTERSPLPLRPRIKWINMDQPIGPVESSKIANVDGGGHVLSVNSSSFFFWWCDSGQISSNWMGKNHMLKPFNAMVVSHKFP